MMGTTLPAVVVAPALISEWTHTALLNVLGFGLLAGVMATGCAFVYRRGTLRPIPAGTGILLGVAFPSLLLVIEGLVQETYIDPSPLVGYASGLYILGVFTGSVVVAEGGRRVGDHLACGVFDIAKLEANGDVAELVRSAGLAVSLTTPAHIGDVEGYPPVDDERKRELAERTLLLPRCLSVTDLETRLCTRLEEDFGVGQVQVEFGSDGSIDSLAVGRRPSGLSPTVPPGMELVAIVGDPAPTASAGDPVEIWRSGADGGRLVATGRLQAADGNVATVLVDAGDADAFEVGDTYRLMTRPDSPHDAHELVGLLRATAETISAKTVDSSDSIEGEFVDWVTGTVLLIERESEGKGDATLIAFPDGRETIHAGDTVHVFGTPEKLSALTT